MNPRILTLLLVGWLVLFGCDGPGQKSGTPQASSAGPASDAVKVPSEYAAGEAAYNRYCIACHGPAASGTDRGPTFIHRIYEPSHHDDGSFYRAAKIGVRAHHWQFGDMPRIEGVSDKDLGQIVAYIRWLQRQGGIQ